MKIKRCPFCGGDKVEVRENLIYRGIYYVICPKCEIATMNYKTPGKAIKRWNRRAGE